MALTVDEPTLKRMFPRASRDFLTANASRVSDPKPQRDYRPTLDEEFSGEEESAQRTIVRIVRFARHPLDDDNFAGGVKALLDQIKGGNLIADDSPKHIDLQTKQEPVATKEEERMEIELTWP